MDTCFSKIKNMFMPSQAVAFHRDSRNSRASPVLMADSRIGYLLYDINEAIPLRDVASVLMTVRMH
jgi:hypothetical protein